MQANQDSSLKNTVPSRRRSQRHSLVAALLLACIGIVGCSGPPSESAGRRAIESQIARESKGNIKLVRFEKTNAQLADNLYAMEFTAEIEFLKDGVWSRGGNPFDPRVSFEFAGGQINRNSIAEFTAAINGAVSVKRGQHETIQSVLRFEKTENGWRAADGKVY